MVHHHGAHGWLCWARPSRGHRRDRAPQPLWVRDCPAIAVVPVRGAVCRGLPCPASSPPPASLSLSSSSPFASVVAARCSQLPNVAPVDLRGRSAGRARVTREGRQKVPACTLSLVPQPCSWPSPGGTMPHCITHSPCTSGCHLEEAGPSSQPAAAPHQLAGGPSRQVRCSQWMSACPSGHPSSTLAHGGRPVGPTFPWPGCLSRSRS